jgi:hypothetical protein
MKNKGLQRDRSPAEGLKLGFFKKNLPLKLPYLTEVYGTKMSLKPYGNENTVSEY